MNFLLTVLRHIPEGAETAILVALSVPCITLVIRLLTGVRWANATASALAMFVYALAAALPINVIGSRIIGPISLALCPPVFFVIAALSLRHILDVPARRKLWAAATTSILLTGFAFVVLVLPHLRASLNPQEYEDYVTCKQNLMEIGQAFQAHAIDHRRSYPPQEDILDVLTKRPDRSRTRSEPYLTDVSVLRCPVAMRTGWKDTTLGSRMLGDYVYAQPARNDPADTYVLRCRRHTRIRRFWTEDVGLYLRKDGKVDVIPLYVAGR